MLSIYCISPPSIGWGRWCVSSCLASLRVIWCLPYMFFCLCLSKRSAKNELRCITDGLTSSVWNLADPRSSTWWQFETFWPTFIDCHVDDYLIWIKLNLRYGRHKNRAIITLFTMYQPSRQLQSSSGQHLGASRSTIAASSSSRRRTAIFSLRLFPPIKFSIHALS